MARCRFCSRSCASNSLMKDRFFREKLQDVICLWLEQAPRCFTLLKDPKEVLRHMRLVSWLRFTVVARFATSLVDVDPDSESEQSDVCRKCEHNVSEFYLFKEQGRDALRKSIGDSKTTFPAQGEIESETLQSLLDNCDEAVELPEEALEGLSTNLGSKVKSSHLRKQRNNSVKLTKRLAKTGKPKRAIRRKTPEEKAMTPEEYKRHYYKLVTERYKQTCEVCGKRMGPERIDGHMNGHKGLQPYACEVCGLQFNCRLNMRKHTQRNHTDGAKFPCPLCGKIMPSKLALKQHTQSVHDEKKFQCTVCGLKILNKNSLARHMNIHTQTRDFVCPHCGKAFYCNSVLTIHLRTHSGETPYNCTICPKGFVHRRIYVMHMQKLHPGEPLMRIDIIPLLKNTLMNKNY